MPEPHWYEDAAGWETLRTVTFSSRQLEAAPREVERLAELLQSEAGIDLDASRVLDMPCGVGRHTLELARRGAQVTGVDLTPSFVAHVASSAASEGLDVQLVEADMRSYRGRDDFDVGLNLYSSLGYSNDRTDDVETLRRYREALRPGGCLVIDTMALSILARIYQPVRYLALDGWVVEERSVLSNSMRTATSTWTLRRDGEVRTAEFSLRVYSVGELMTMLEEAGFVHTKAFGGLSGCAYDVHARRLVLLSRTPDAP